MRKLWLLLVFCSAVMYGQLASMPFRPVDAQYSYSLDRIVAVSSSPAQVHIYDPVLRADVVVNLPKAPLAVSVSPDGKFAAVGHDALISYVSLTTAAVLKTFTVSSTVRDIVLSTDYIYADGATVQISTGAITKGYGDWYSNRATYPRLHPGLKAIYNTRDGTSPNDIEKTDISAGTVGAHTDSPYHGDYPACGGVWFSPDGKRIYTGCASIYTSSADPALEMTYRATLGDIGRIRWLDESRVRTRIAAIPMDGTTWPYESTRSDSEFVMFDSATLQSLGTFRIPQFALPSKSYNVHGKWIFFSADGQYVHVVGQVDTSSGLQNDYVVYTYRLDGQPSCLVTLAPTTLTAGYAGQTEAATVTAAADCYWRIKSDTAWLQPVATTEGSGNGSFTFIVRPNTTSVARTGTLRAGAATLTITQEAAPATLPAITRLSFNVLDAEFSKSLNRVVAVSASPYELHVLNPLTKADQWVSLAYRPLSVSVRPDGLYAAVGHDGWISLVNLQTLAVERVYEMYTDVNDIVLAANGYMYAFPRRSWSDIYSVEVATGKITAISAIYEGRTARLHSSGKSLYVGDWDFSKWDISAGTLKLAASPWNLDVCGNLWLTEDGTRMVTACGKVYRTSDVPADDFQYNGQLSNSGNLTWADHSSVRKTTAVSTLTTPTGTPITEIQFYGDAYLGLSGRYSVPKLTIGDTAYTQEPRFLFWDKTAAGLAVLVRAPENAKLASSWGLMYISPDSQPSTCSFALSGAQPVAAAGGFGTVALNTGTDCFWSASSNASWLQITSGGFGTGSVNVGFSADPNPTNAQRTATITVGAATITITQAAAAMPTCTYQFASAGFFPSAEGGKTPVIMIASDPRCAWTVMSDRPWVQVYPLSGTGSATLSATVFPNFRSTLRTAGIKVTGATGVPFLTTQAASTHTQTERFVDLLYFGFFGRLPTTPELAFHTKSLTAGTTRADAATNFMGSSELALGGKYVGGVYIGILNRDAEYGGWLFQRNAMIGAQVSPQALVANFLGSAEYGLRFGTPNNSEFVRLLYRYILGREASTAEVNFQAGALTGGTTRSFMAYNFLSSTEFRTRTNARLDAFLLYTGLLSRNPTDTELTATMATINNSGLKAAIANLLATPEFETLIQ